MLVQCQKGDGKERTNKNKLPLTDKTTLNRSLDYNTIVCVSTVHPVVIVNRIAKKYFTLTTFSSAIVREGSDGQ